MTDENIPPSVLNSTEAIKTFNKKEKPKLDRDRYAFALILTLIIAGIQAGTLFYLFPLKSTVPFIIETDKSGKTEVVGPAYQAFSPTKAQIIFNISKWTQNLWSIDKALVSDNLKEAYAMTRGKASDVFRDHVNARKPIERSTMDKSLSASVEVKTINLLREDTALVRLIITERVKDKEPVVETYMMTLHWVIVPPKTTEEIMKNPIGFYITDFSWTKEVSGK